MWLSVNRPNPRRNSIFTDVHLSPRTQWVKTAANRIRGGILNGGGYELRGATMLDLIETAYFVDTGKIYGGPSWFDYDRFEIVAKAPPGARPETLLLRSLPADRFKLTVKQDTRLDYVLSGGQGPPKTEIDPELKRFGAPKLASGHYRDDVPYANTQRRNVTLDAFAGALRQLTGALLDRLPVVNSTNLEGAWDIPNKPAPNYETLSRDAIITLQGRVVGVAVRGAGSDPKGACIRNRSTKLGFENEEPAEDAPSARPEEMIASAVSFVNHLPPAARRHIPVGGLVLGIEIRGRRAIPADQGTGADTL